MMISMINLYNDDDDDKYDDKYDDQDDNDEYDKKRVWWTTSLLQKYMRNIQKTVYL